MDKHIKSRNIVALEAIIHSYINSHDDFYDALASFVEDSNRILSLHNNRKKSMQYLWTSLQISEAFIRELEKQYDILTIENIIK